MWLERFVRHSPDSEENNKENSLGLKGLVVVWILYEQVYAGTLLQRLRNTAHDMQSRVENLANITSAPSVTQYSTEIYIILGFVSWFLVFVSCISYAEYDLTQITVGLV